MVKPIFSQDDIHKIYLEWMNETEFGSERKDRFLNSLKDIPISQQIEIEKWILSSIAIGLEEGYNAAMMEKQDEKL